MTSREELLELLLVERFGPIPPAPEPVELDDSELAVKRRTRTLDDEMGAA